MPSDKKASEAIRLLENYKKKVEPLLVRYFDAKIEQASKVDALAEEAVRMIADFTLAAGKRIRPALVYYGYLAAGGREVENIIEASIGIELAHTFLLIHDDIIDKDARRHGVSTLHERYKKIGRRLNFKKDAVHFGNSMAMLAGDMANAMANEIIFNSQFSPEVIVRALDKLQEIVYTIVPGEMLDLILETRGRATEVEVLRMYEGKTASYSFEGPLHLGSLMAGKENGNMLKDFSAYAYPVGKAFQIKDDIIGLFGSEKKIGKPVGSDIIEGKETLLVVKTRELGNRNQRAIIRKYLGKKDIKKPELEEFQMAVRESGSLDYAEKLADSFIQESLAVLDGINVRSTEAEVFLRGMAEYMMTREF
ncbi:MAG: polyprenyl synthetase family protein [Candidatus Pacebacteria bacterium]|nr:polyprenyl synthetase family protein [Candidatus Paceibacterota bacterium]MDR3583334.1 polyprenyl synthetase family protein [Candidatus Paceibacterota bacterium]